MSEIIHLLNDRFGTEFTDADKLVFDQIETELVQDEKLQMQGGCNSFDHIKFSFDEAFISKLIERMEDSQEIFEKILGHKEIRNVVKKWS